jgi:hypothetical protein
MALHLLLMSAITLIPVALLCVSAYSLKKKLALVRGGVRVDARAVWVWREDETGGGAYGSEEQVILAFKDGNGREMRIRRVGWDWYASIRKRGDVVRLLYPPGQPAQACLAANRYLYGSELALIALAILIVCARVLTGV